MSFPSDIRATRGFRAAVRPSPSLFPQADLPAASCEDLQMRRRCRQNVRVRVTRCPRCFAEDISADAHPSRRLIDGALVSFFVCRGCFRAAELEFRISCDGASMPYARLSIRESLRLLRGFYEERQREAPDDARVTAALDEVVRRLSITQVERAPRLDA